jgi:two-component system NarL family sensor kinase
VFPDGALPSRRWRPVAASIVAITAISTLALAIGAWDYPWDFLTSFVEYTGQALLMLQIATVGILLLGIGFLTTLGSLWLRWRRASGETRQQLACLLAAAVLLALGITLDVIDLPGVPGADLIIGVALPLGMTVAVLRYQLYGLDQVVNRTIVWLVMTLLVIVGFVGIVAVLRGAVMGGSTSNASLVATGLIAMTFEPLRRRVQRGVDHLLYGDRDDPYVVIARLGDLLGRTVEPNAVLPLLTGTIARSLRVPYVAVTFSDGEKPRLLAEHGTETSRVESFDLIIRGRRVGRLLVGTRTAGARFSRRERRLLSDLALQAAVAVDATRLIRDLQESRERLVMAREEERRRLRRDLHDGVGPALAGMSMQVRAAHSLVTGPTRVGEILGALGEDLKGCTVELRKLVDELRPPVLDSGLEAALRAECERFDAGELSVRLRVDGVLGGLPAAVEVAVYRIVAEALANVARHAQATTCRVMVTRARDLTLTIVDDGVGIGPLAQPGVGLDSMRERAEELGGDTTISPATPRGTEVLVHLPVPAAPLASTNRVEATA